MDSESYPIKSVLDTDLYKITMQLAVCRLYPREKVRYKFIDRNNQKYPDGFAEELKKYIEKMKDIELTDQEKRFLLDKCYYLDPVYIDFLSGYRYDPSEVKIAQHLDGTLHISVEGYWYRTILWEVPILALISELYFKMTIHF